jgi:hypothetical protein
MMAAFMYPTGSKLERGWGYAHVEHCSSLGEPGRERRPYLGRFATVLGCFRTVPRRFRSAQDVLPAEMDEERRFT